MSLIDSWYLIVIGFMIKKLVKHYASLSIISKEPQNINYVALICYVHFSTNISYLYSILLAYQLCCFLLVTILV